MLKQRYKVGEILSMAMLLAMPGAIVNFPLSGHAHVVELAPRAQNISPQVQAENLLQQGLEQLGAGNDSEATGPLADAALLFHRIGDLRSEVMALRHLGLAYDNLGEYQKAVDTLENALSIIYQDSQIQGVSEIVLIVKNDVLTLLASPYLSLGQFTHAADVYQESLLISRQLNDREHEGEALAGIAITHGAIGQYEHAIDSFQQSLEIGQSIDNARLTGVALVGLGITYSDIGRYEVAVTYHQRALSLFQSIGDQDAESRTLINLGNIYLELYEDEQALNSLERSLAIAQNLGNRDTESLALGAIGKFYVAFEQYEEAIETYQESFELALQITNRDSQGLVLSQLGNVYAALDQHELAIDFTLRSLRISQELNDLHSQSIALNNLGSSYLATQQFLKAEESLRAAIEIHDGLRTSGLSDTDQIALFENQKSSYSLLQKVLVTQKKYESSLEAAEQGRARAFINLLTQKLSRENSAVSTGSPSIAEIKALSQQKQATFVEYSILDFSDDQTNPILYIWVVSSTGDITFRQKELTNINLATLIADTLTAIGVQPGERAGAPPQLKPEELARLRINSTDAEDKLTQLHELLIDPILDLLPTDPNQSVVFIPQNELFLVPFPALKNANGDYLIEHHTVLTSPSIQVVQLTQSLADRSNRVLPLKMGTSLIVGNPTMPTVTYANNGEFKEGKLHSLPGAEEEAVEIWTSDLLRGNVLIGAQATESRIKQQIDSADVIHLATHGLLEYGDPQETGSRDTPGAIALAPGNGEDGLLTSSEILQMDLQADLVVLSACDTGRGRITGDGVIGLSRSFIAAGVPSVVVSLWAIPDSPTAELMAEFYRQLDQGKSKAHALRQAMLITMQTHPDPKDWAAFTLIGHSE